MIPLQPETQEDFETVAQEVWEGLPEEFRKVVGNLSMQIADFAGEATLMQMRIRNPYELLGLYHGVGLGLENLVLRRRPQWFEDHRVWTPLRWLACYGFVTYGWLLFFYPVGTVWQMTVGPIVAIWGS